MTFPSGMSITLRLLAFIFNFGDPVIVFCFLQQFVFITSYTAKLRAFSSGFNFVDKISNPVYTLAMNIYNDKVNQNKIP